VDVKYTRRTANIFCLYWNILHLLFNHMAQGAVEIWTQVFNNSVRPYEIILNIKDMFFKSYEFAFVSLVNIPFMLSV